MNIKQLQEKAREEITKWRMFPDGDRDDLIDYDKYSIDDLIELSNTLIEQAYRQGKADGLSRASEILTNKQ